VTATATVRLPIERVEVDAARRWTRRPASLLRWRPRGSWRAGRARRWTAACL